MKPDAPIQSPEDYLASLPEPRQGEMRVLHRAICAAAPELKPFMQSGMLGYGRYHYRYASGREGDWFVVGLASRKNEISLHYCVCDGEGYFAEKNATRLGKVTAGRSCVRFKRLSDLNLPEAMELVRQAAILSARPDAFSL